jgi:hypothetical protein
MEKGSELVGVLIIHTSITPLPYMSRQDGWMYCTVRYKGLYIQDMYLTLLTPYLEAEDDGPR